MRVWAQRPSLGAGGRAPWPCLAFLALASAALPAVAQTRYQTGPLPVVPDAPPPPAVIPPPDAAPPHPTAPPPPPVVDKGAPGLAEKIPYGVRLVFGAGRSDFNPGAEAALLALADAGKTDASLIYNVYAHAPGTPQDTSTPRRLSLERALGVRSALIHAGIVSTRIYVHAMGANGLTQNAPDDRVDVTLADLASDKPIAAPASAQGSQAAP